MERKGEGIQGAVCIKLKWLIVRYRLDKESSGI